jgi:hypothetical protein
MQSNSAVQATPSLNEDLLNAGRFYLEGCVIMKNIQSDLKEAGASKYDFRHPVHTAPPGQLLRSSESTVEALFRSDVVPQVLKPGWILGQSCHISRSCNLSFCHPETHTIFREQNGRALLEITHGGLMFYLFRSRLRLAHKLQ